MELTSLSNGRKLVGTESLSLFNRYLLIRRNILDDFARAARPSDFPYFSQSCEKVFHRTTIFDPTFVLTLRNVNASLRPILSGGCFWSEAQHAVLVAAWPIGNRPKKFGRSPIPAPLDGSRL